jgi:hypothetical protein
MPDLDFRITAVEAVTNGLVPSVSFKVEIQNQPETENIPTVLLHAQIQIQSPQRAYNAVEKEKLGELFGKPERWGQTLRNRLWGHAATTVRGFVGATTASLSMPCTFDLNVAATKYFHALEDGDVPLLFLFSGTVFYEERGQLRVQQISWSKEEVFRMPVKMWREMMDRLFPNTAWLYLRRDLFDQLCAYRRAQGCINWEETVSRLLANEQRAEAIL